MIRFLQPWWLLPLLPVLALAAAYVWRQLHRQAYAVRFTNVDLLRTVAPKGLGWRRHVPAVALLLGLLVLATALARPSVDTRQPLERATVMLAIDVSLSMQADDVAPTRLEAAQEAAKQFVAELPESYNVGLVSFAKSANVLVSPTKDRAAVTPAIDGLTLAEATATGEAVFTCLEAIRIGAGRRRRRASRRPGSCCSPTGTAPSGRSVEEAAAAASAAQRAGLDDRLRHRRAAPSTSAASCSGCRSTGRRCRSSPRPPRATSTRPRRSSELKQVYQDMGSSIGYRTEPREITQWYAGGALLLLLAAGAASLLWTSRLV